MDKPEDIAQWAWDKAKTHLMQANTKGRMLGEPTDPLECISRAILSAQSQAYIDAARIAEKDGDREISWSEMSLPVSPGPIIAKDRAKVASRISAAILSRKDEVGRN